MENLIKFFESLDDEFGEVSNFEKPPREQKFNKKKILDLTFQAVKKDFPESPEFSLNDKITIRSKSYGGMPAWQASIQHKGSADIIITVTPVKTYAAIRVVVRWTPRPDGHAYMKVEKIKYTYVKGAQTLDPETN
jgi:hypothetical protein